MNELLNDGYCRVVVRTFEPLIAEGFAGKSKKAKWIYRFKSHEELAKYAQAFAEKMAAYLSARKEQLAAYKDQKKERAEKAKLEIMSNLKVGCFMKYTWGATMHRVEWYEVTEVNGNNIKLRPANYEDNSGGWSGTSTLIGSCPGEATCGAKVRNGRILFDRGNSSWKYLSFAKIGDQEHVFCD